MSWSLVMSSKTGELRAQTEAVQAHLGVSGILGTDPLFQPNGRFNCGTWPLIGGLTPTIYVVMRRPSTLNALLEVGNDQGGYVSGAQSRRLGVTKREIERLLNSGDLKSVRPGVYRMRHAQTRFEDDIAAWLHLQRGTLPWERRDEPRAVLSHQSAAALQDLGTIIPTEPTFTALRGGITEADGLVLHRMRLPRQDWAWSRSGTMSLPVTTPARTIVDLILAHEELSYIERAVREAFSRDQTTVDELRETAMRRKTNSGVIQKQVAKLLEVVA